MSELGSYPLTWGQAGPGWEDGTLRSRLELMSNPGSTDGGGQLWLPDFLPHQDTAVSHFCGFLHRAK